MPPNKKAKPNQPSPEAKQREDLFSQGLTKEQRRVLEFVEAGKNVFLTGKAGTGKSHTLRQVIKLCQAKYPEQHAVAVTASTGLAAQNIGGRTTHSWAALRLAQESVDELFNKLFPPVKERLRKTKVLIIDEISMLDGEFFGKLDGVLKKLDRNAGSNTPFGGIQLPPVSTAGRVAQFAFETQSWKDAIKRESCIVLSEIHRQTDTRLISILNELRSGILTPATNNILSNQYFPLQIPFGMKPVQLFPTREQVTRFNQENLERLDGTQFGFVAGISGSTVEDRETFVENAMAPFILNLKIGAEVMLLKNLTEDLVNGSRGRVVSVNLPEKAVTVDFCVKRETTTEMIRKELKAETWTYVNPSTKAEVNYVQIPLMLSYSMTIHKSQGLTIPYLCVDLRNIFAPGQVYVAISRAVSLDSLQVLNFSRTKVTVDTRVTTFMRTFYI